MVVAWQKSLLVLLLAASGCERDEPPRKPSPARAQATSAAPGSPAPPLGLSGFPRVTLDAAPGQRVLAPAPSAVERRRPELELRAVPFYAARLVSVGADASRIESAAGHRADVPNALIVPLPPSEDVAAGDLVLTSWARGAGLRRAIVVAGGSAHEPRVRYLEPTLESGEDVGGRRAESELETLPEGSFRRIAQAGDVGASLACGDRASPEHFILIAKQGDRLLGLGPADRVSIFERAACVELALRPKLGAGTWVQAPLFGRYQPVRVKRVEPGAARVTASYDTPAGPSSAVFAWPDVLPPAPRQ